MSTVVAPPTLMRLLEWMPRVDRETLLDSDHAAREVVAVYVMLQLVNRIRNRVPIAGMAAEYCVPIHALDDDSSRIVGGA